MEVIWFIKRLSSDERIISYVKNLDNIWLDFDEFKYLIIHPMTSGLVMFRITNSLVNLGKIWVINLNENDLLNDIRDKVLNEILV